MKSFEFVSMSESQTERFAAKLASACGRRAFIALNGEMGSGKTAFSRGFVKQFGANASSPTFAIVNEYHTIPKVLHFDVYRLVNPEELDETGYEWDCFDGIVLMEWAQKFLNNIPTDRIDINFASISENQRLVCVTAYENSIGILERLIK